jgi:hypothetical protein
MLRGWAADAIDVFSSQRHPVLLRQPLDNLEVSIHARVVNGLATVVVFSSQLTPRPRSPAT